MEANDDLYEPYGKLISINILGQRVEVPENNSLLRCFQFLSIETISYGDFCWNGDCANCEVWYHEAGQKKDRPALACRLRAQEGLVITGVARFIKLEGINK